VLEPSCGKIGAGDTAAICAAIRGAGNVLVDLAPGQVSSATTASTFVRAHVTRATDGICIVGGPEVVPHIKMDTLSAALAPSVSRAQDDDGFIVWSDAVYGSDDAGSPVLPVSRIPDASSASFVWTCLSAVSAVPAATRGIRNINRPFADAIYAGLSGPVVPMLTSEPTVSGAYSLASEWIYVMLHGSDSDATAYWGESSGGGYPVATRIGDVPAVAGSVALAGCCWGALLTTAMASAPGPISSRAVSDSIALSFLDRGALAFAGCTGTHYSPTRTPYGYYGGPLHEAFWRRLAGGAPPARALFEAKYLDYARAIPHGLPAPLDRAIEEKILHQFTSLGLGW
jgi:hypothetical protein